MCVYACVRTGLGWGGQLLKLSSFVVTCSANSYLLLNSGEYFTGQSLTQTVKARFVSPRLASVCGHFQGWLHSLNRPSFDWRPLEANKVFVTWQWAEHWLVQATSNTSQWDYCVLLYRVNSAHGSMYSKPMETHPYPTVSQREAPKASLLTEKIVLFLRCHILVFFSFLNERNIV